MILALLLLSSLFILPTSQEHDEAGRETSKHKGGNRDKGRPASAKKCPLPGIILHGRWTCEVNELLPGTEDQIYTALQCRLECEAGYISQKTPLITCVDGIYEPFLA